MARRARGAWVGSLCFAVAVGFWGLGALLYRLPVGLDASAFPLGGYLQGLFPGAEHAMAGAVWLGVGLLGVAAIAFFWVRGAVRRSATGVDGRRRSFLRGTGAGLAAGLAAFLASAGAASLRALYGLGEGNGGWAGVNANIPERQVAFTHPEWRPAWRGSRIQSYRRFGRTGWEISDIVLGSGAVRGERGEQITREVIERGVNYIDTAPDYSAEGSEWAVGRAIRGRRDQLFIATKFCTPIGHLPAGTPVARYERAIEESLRRLGSDYVDLVHVHSCDSVDRIVDENLHEAFDRLKEAGKARFLGFSSHTPNLLEVADTAIASGRFDVMMLAYHHGLWPSIGQVIARARSEQDMGVVAMKTLKGAKHRGLQDFQPYADAYSQAALKWVLANPDVSCAVISFFEPQHVDEYLHASGGRLSDEDLATLGEYDRRVAGTYCAPHCGQCLDACPEGVPIPDVLRDRMYFEDYGREKEGIERYAALERDASACASCSAPCLGSCPLGIDIARRTKEAHRMLTLP